MTAGNYPKERSLFSIDEWLFGAKGCRSHPQQSHASRPPTDIGKGGRLRNFLVHIAPIRTDAQFHDQGDRKFVGVLHFFSDESGKNVAFLCRRLEKKLIMYLQNHFGLELFFREAP